MQGNTATKGATVAKEWKLGLTADENLININVTLKHSHACNVWFTWHGSQTGLTETHRDKAALCGFSTSKLFSILVIWHTAPPAGLKLDRISGCLASTLRNIYYFHCKTSHPIYSILHYILVFIVAAESERPKWHEKILEIEEESAAKQQIGQGNFCKRILGRQSKVDGFIPGQLGALCQWPGCYSPNYKPMNFNTDLEAGLL